MRAIYDEDREWGFVMPTVKFPHRPSCPPFVVALPASWGTECGGMNSLWLLKLAAAQAVQNCDVLMESVIKDTIVCVD